MDISKLLKDIESAVRAVASSKDELLKAQDVLDKAKAAHQAALDEAQKLHGSLQNQLASLIPGLNK